MTTGAVFGENEATGPGPNRPTGDGPSVTLTMAENEAVFLDATVRLIDTMLSPEVVKVQRSAEGAVASFPSAINLRYFNIILVDFLSQTDRKAPVLPSSYLGALDAIIAAPVFSSGNSGDELRLATDSFREWLNREVAIEVWLPSIPVETTLHMSRLRFLIMAGNISKHDMLRAVGVASELQASLAKAGHSVPLDGSLLALGDFFERYHTDLLAYHASTIAEFLNNIRWGIHDYLQPEFVRSLVWDTNDPIRYRFTYPDGLSHPFARECYWNLMNEMRHPPQHPRFAVPHYFKLRY